MLRKGKRWKEGEERDGGTHRYDEGEDEVCEDVEASVGVA